MTQWEYKSVGSANFEAPEIKELGMEGWELVAMVTIMYRSSPITNPEPLPVFMFKRPFIGKTDLVT